MSLEKEYEHALSDIKEEVSTDAYNLIVELIKTPGFMTWSGSSKPHQHHYGDFGLARHTLEVTALCLCNANGLVAMETLYGETRHVDLSVLLTAAFYHDIGKLYDYEKIDYNWVGTDHKRRIHHISRSALIFHQNCAKLHVTDNEFIDKVLHCILSHHGTREWGSPVMPLTVEAWILHLCDNLSARTYEAFKGLDILNK